MHRYHKVVRGTDLLFKEITVIPKAGWRPEGPSLTSYVDLESVHFHKPHFFHLYNEGFDVVFGSPPNTSLSYVIFYSRSYLNDEKFSRLSYFVLARFHAHLSLIRSLKVNGSLQIFSGDVSFIKVLSMLISL